MAELCLQAETFREYRAGGRRALLHLPTTGLFDLEEVSGAVLDLFKQRERVSTEEIQQYFNGTYHADSVIGALTDFAELGIINRGEGRTRDSLKALARFPLNTLVLNVTTGCNLGCSYCYREDVTATPAARRMDPTTASKAVDLLLVESSPGAPLNLAFFGGEPLTNLPLIRAVVDYAEARCAEVERPISFTLTTNATLLTRDVARYLDQHRFGIAISMDGPEALHDRHRRTLSGQGSYARVAANVRELLAEYRSRPVGARVTLGAGSTQVEHIYDHLKHDLGFAEVVFAPVTSGTDRRFALSETELAEIFAAMKRLGRHYVAAACRRESHGFSNMHQLVTDLWRGTHKTLPCGAGIGMLAVGTDGDLHLCHRFSGSDWPAFGSVRAGVNKKDLNEFLGRAHEAGNACAGCSARGLCAGGCYHEAWVRQGSPFLPTSHYCQLIRDWTDFGVEAFLDIAAANPGYFERTLEPRRAQS